MHAACIATGMWLHPRDYLRAVTACSLELDNLLIFTCYKKQMGRFLLKQTPVWATSSEIWSSTLLFVDENLTHECSEPFLCPWCAGLNTVFHEKFRTVYQKTNDMLSKKKKNYNTSQFKPVDSICIYICTISWVIDIQNEDIKYNIRSDRYLALTAFNALMCVMWYLW